MCLHVPVITYCLQSVFLKANLSLVFFKSRSSRASCLQVDTLHSGEYIGDEIDEAEERRARRAVALSFLSNMYVHTILDFPPARMRS